MLGKKESNGTKTVEQKPSKYFEIFGDTINQLNFLKKCCFFLIMLAIFESIIIVKSINKLPLVLHVDSIGNAQVVKYDKSILAVSPIEVSNFTQYFIQYFSAYDFHAYDDNFTRAFKMMTEECQRKLNDYLTINNVVDNIKSNQLKTTLKISNITTINDSKDWIDLKVKGTREVRSYQNTDFNREEIFEAEMSIKKVKRTENTPWGLLVDAWSETLFKK
ncbi:MAG: VirB8/TrbF family protein [Elusimicrobia bacterium]|nr:VirB8/TrbF family protein [Elusimicrobiota bacterium]